MFLRDLRISVKLYLLVACFLGGFVIFGLFAKNTLDTFEDPGTHL